MAHLLHQQARRMLLPLAADRVHWLRLASSRKRELLAACCASGIHHCLYAVKLKDSFLLSR